MRYVYSARSFVAAAFLAGCVLLPASADGQEAEGPTHGLRAPVWTLPLDSRADAAQTSLRRERPDLGDTAQRPGALLPLYASLGALQALDIHSTSRGLAAGGREANPMMAPVVENRAAFIAVKAATTVGVVWASERLWRKQNRKAAVVLTALTNIGLAAVVAHNYRAAR